MNRNNSNGSFGCFSQEDLVAYLYGEIKETDRARLDMHLSGCRVCTEDFAALSESHFSIYEWQREEFASLSTPEITGPWQNLSEPERSVPTPNSLSWLDRAKASIAAYPRWAFAAVALCFLAMIIWLGFINLRTVSIPNEATVYENTIPRSTNAAPVPNELKPSPEVAVTRPFAKKDVSEPANSSERRVVAQTRKTSVVAVADNARQHQRHQGLADSRGRRPEIARKAPNLSGIEEDEDNTLRLADLFAEVGGGK